MLRAWYTSCVSCLWPQADQESKRLQAQAQKHQPIGVEREMQICHSQPHLVPPMKLVFYGDLPSPGAVSPSKSSPSLPPWVHETKSLANRASRRASVLLTRKKTQSQLTISAPTDFRRVDPPQRRSSFRPLELSIYSPGNRLSDLPEFSGFDLDVSIPPSPLPRALMSPFNSAGHLRRDSSPFHLARKPVGSAPSRRSSLATVELQLQQAQMQARQSMDAILLSPLIPHFSVFNSPTQYSPQQDFKSPLESQRPLGSVYGLPAQTKPLPDEPVSLADIPLSPLKSAPLPTDRSSFDHHRGNKNSVGKRQSSQPHSLSSLRHNSNPSHSTVHHQSVKSSSSTYQTHSRIRTTSNSTTSSRTPSLSSAITAATTILPSEREIEGMFPTLPMIPASVKNSVVVEEPQVHDEQDVVPGGYEFDQRFPSSPIGVAF